MRYRWADNLSTKILSLLLASLLWLFVIGKENPVVTRDFHGIPVSILNGETLKEHDLVQTGMSTPAIDVRVSAKRDAINSIRSEDITAFANVSGYGEGVHNVPVRVQVPSGVAIDRVSDQTASIKIEQLIEGEFVVDVELREALPDNMVLESLTASPESVKIKEPRSLMDQIDTVKALVVAPASGENAVANVAVEAFDASGQPLTEVETTPKMVNVALATSFIKELPIALTYSGTLPEDIRITEGSVSPSTVFLKSDKTTMDEFPNVKTETVDISKLNDSISGKLSLQLPDGVVIRDSNQDFTYQISIERKVTRDFEVSAEDVAIKNLSPGLKGQVSFASPLVVTLKGYDGELKAVEQKDLEVFVDATDLSVGVHTLEVTVLPPDGLLLEKKTITTTSVILSQ